ncbi:MAG: HNH endonuclease [Eubacteriales bacterium]|nr:HNH endonuclease [Eubacteriales bacterium]
MVEQLKTDFHNKCYLCEMKDLQDPQIEHLLPHKNGRYPERKYDWNNLFWSCAHCNSMKNQDKYDAGIIDCCRQDPEELIFFRLRDKQVEITTTVSGNDKTSALTAELIYEIFNKSNTGMRVYKSAVRLKLLTKEISTLLLR